MTEPKRWVCKACGREVNLETDNEMESGCDVVDDDFYHMGCYLKILDGEEINR